MKSCDFCNQIFSQSCDFCNQIFSLRITTLTAIGGYVAGKFCGISPLHGAVYAVASCVAYQSADMIGNAILSKLSNRMGKSVNEFMVMPLLVTSVYLSYKAGNKALALMGKQSLKGQLTLETAVKVSIVSGITGFFSGLLIDYMRG
ncbi:MAG: hypothetical protein C5B45_05655 [Chlamydiae bacterium]|nr:MAG: hypothetical protein C5B45_05655 [Chlamydiota bacterium]